MLPPGTQLGKIERRLLLDAPAFDALPPPHDHQWAPVWSYAPGVSGRTAARRAALKLQRLGLLDLSVMDDDPARPALVRRSGIEAVKKLSGSLVAQGT
jgi:hypothetical protein